MNNFQTCYAIVSGLQLSCVSRLKQTWDKIPKKVKAQFDQLLQVPFFFTLFSLSFSFIDFKIF